MDRKQKIQEIVSHENLDDQQHWVGVFDKFKEQLGYGTYGSLKRHTRLARCYKVIEDLYGYVAECGSWKGMSSSMICEAMGNQGDNFYIIDSFEGLSEFNPQKDVPKEISDELLKNPSQPVDPQLQEVFGKECVRTKVDSALAWWSRWRGDKFACSLEDLKKNHSLNDFNKITYFKGWIPQVFSQLPEQQYRLVHIDVDLHDPTKDCIEYFYPRMVNEGIMICDDYWSTNFAGARRYVDDFCSAHKDITKIANQRTETCVMYKEN